MQTLSKVPVEHIRVGDRVKSRVTHIEGTILEIIPVEQARRCEDNEFFIRWDNSNTSFQWHYMYDRVWLM